MHPSRPRFISPATSLAVAAAIVPGYLQAHFDGRGSLPLALLTSAAFILSTAALGWAERRPALHAVGAVLVAYAAAVVAAVWVSEGRAILVAMPLVSMLVLYFSWRASLAGSLLLVGLVGLMGVHLKLPNGVTLGALIGAASAFAFVIVFSLIARQERYARLEIERLSSELEHLAATRERNRIAREIHDSLGHCLTVAAMQLEAARGKPEESDTRIARVQALLRDGLSELRSSVSMLREPVQTPPLAEALAELVAEHKAAGLAAELSTSGQPRALSGATGFALFRAAQEALTNVRRHAQARRVTVTLDYQAERVALAVADDGIGAAADAPRGNGLEGLRERIQLVGGALRIESSPGAGFAVRVEVPA